MGFGDIGLGFGDLKFAYGEFGAFDDFAGGGVDGVGAWDEDFDFHAGFESGADFVFEVDVGAFDGVDCNGEEGFDKGVGDEAG